jgi:hypothetical protein
MGQVYKDKAGNTLFIGKKIYAKNREGKLIDRKGVDTLLKRANSSGKIKLKGKNIGINNELDQLGFL